MSDTVTAIPPALGIERYLFGTTVPGLMSVCSVTPWRALLTWVQSPGNCVVNPGALSACVCAWAAAGRPPSTVAAAVTARIDLIAPEYPGWARWMRRVGRRATARREPGLSEQRLDRRRFAGIFRLRPCSANVRPATP